MIKLSGLKAVNQKVNSLMESAQKSYSCISNNISSHKNRGVAIMASKMKYIDDSEIDKHVGLKGRTVEIIFYGSVVWETDCKVFRIIVSLINVNIKDCIHYRLLGF